ncbi:hypothetical protein PR202_gb11542 [Eleusine coracana subsp. coracana]|uniref:RNase H type-1 domain-containing protein n=1 Tax=Eleusine coracana subsp. coracana TaxID=191504 RepID=A0AAV5EMS3_ELECO|nr:hypothetical protein PR202_gb11542 [Eleusine coracana subsp. coracana]
MVRQPGDPVIGKGKAALWTENTDHSRTRRVETDTDKRWIPPEEGWIKINVDGGYTEQNGRGSIGVIARRQDGSVCFTVWRVVLRCVSALEAEALACVEGLRMATEWAHGRIIIESDCARVVAALNNAGEDRS